MTASSLRPASHFSRSMGATTSASWRFCRLRHLLPLSSRSLMAMSVRPRSLRFATTFDPMNPAPPVTSSIGPLPAGCWFFAKTASSFAPVRPPAQYRPDDSFGRNPDTIRAADPEDGRRIAQVSADWTRSAAPATAWSRDAHAFASRGRPDPDRSLHVDRRFRTLSLGGEAAAGALPRPPDRLPHDQL